MNDDETPRDALGDELWAALGASKAPEPRWTSRHTAAVARKGPPWPGWLPGLLAASLLSAALGAAAWSWSRPAPASDALVAELELVEHLDLLSHPDFDVLVAWDGVAP